MPPVQENIMDNNKNMNDILNIAIAQIAPEWLNKKATIKKIEEAIREAVIQNAELVCFGETLMPGYPFWLELTDGARFNSTLQKEIFAFYLNEAVSIEQGDLYSICALAKTNKIAVYLGCAERAGDRGGHSIYCSLLYIDKAGIIQSIHRKLMPTYEERLAWSIAKENRMYVLSVSGLMRNIDIKNNIPHHALIRQNANDFLGNGGSCIAAPDGSWIIEPIVGKEVVVTATINLNEVRKERQNFDPSGHYSRPDVFELNVDIRRQKLVNFQSE